MNHLSIVIVNYNTYQLTINCIRSIYKYQSALRYEIIVVDNGSAESLPDKFAEDFPEVKLIGLKKNEGFARGNNAGISIATAPVILLLNSDTLVFDDSIERTYHYLLAKTDVGMIGCKLLNEDKTEQLSSFIKMKYPLLNLFINTNVLISKVLSELKLFKSHSKHLELVREQQQTNHYCEAVSGAFMMFKNDVIKPAGYLDPDFFLYAEETDWCRNRICKFTNIFYYKEASIIHLGGRSSISEFSEKQMLLSAFLYSYKRSLSFYLMVLLIYFINSIINLPVLLVVKKSSAKRIFVQIKSFVMILPDLLFDIPKYNRAPGSRLVPLMTKEFKALTQK